MANKQIIVEGDNYQDALLKGLNILNLTEEQVKVEILEEKKGFLFKKGLLKLQITPISADDGKEQISNKDVYAAKKAEFYLDYRPDGVYLTILKDSKISIGDILDFLSKKSVKDYDYEKLNQCIEAKKGMAEKIAPYQEELLIDSTLQINLSKTKQEATILLTEPSGGKTLSTAEIIHSLNERGIVFGVNNDKIEEIVKKNIFDEPVVIAQGKAPINGNNGQAIYAFDDELDTPNTVIEEDGSIDYKNLDKIRNVKTGTLLMEIIPPTEGVNGVDVYGNEVFAKQGSPVAIKRGKNVVESEDGLKIYASKDGEVYFVDGTIYVDEVINIDGNIDNETGNIQFNGKVNIKGNVKSGFKVEAEGDIEIFGVVESATLISKGNIIIHRGVQGNNQAELSCLGNFKSKYIENASVRSAGDVEADVILHSDVIAKGKITALGKKGLIVGGNIKAGQEVRASVLGSNMGTATRIEVGIDPEEKNHYEQLKTEMIDMEKNIESSKKAIELLNRMAKKQEMTKEKQELLVKSLKTYRVLKTKHDTLAIELQSLAEKFQEANNGKIHGSTIIHSGVRVVIGNSPKQIYDELSNCTLYIKDGEVTVGPYER